MALGSTEPLTEMSTRSISWGWRRPVRKADNISPPCAVTKSGNLNSLEPSGPLRACNGTALPLPLPQYCFRTSYVKKNISWIYWMNEYAVMFSTRQCSTVPETRTLMQRSVYESNILLQRDPLPFTRPSTSEIKVILNAILLVCRVLCRAFVIFFCKAISMKLLFKTVFRSWVEERPPRVYILTLLCMMFLVNNGVYNAKK